MPEQRRFDLAEQAAHLRREALGERGVAHHASFAREDGIAEQLAQARERVAHRGLAEPDASPRRGHAALAQERVERDEQVEIERRQAR